MAFDGQEKEVARYEKNLVYAKRSGIIRSALVGASGGLFWLLMFSSYALAFWFGVKLVMDDTDECIENPEECNIRYTAGGLTVVSLAVLIHLIT